MIHRKYSDGAGEISFVDGDSFRYYNKPGEEIYGWIQSDHSIVKGSNGFWRTNDPEEAARRCSTQYTKPLLETEQSICVGTCT